MLYSAIISMQYKLEQFAKLCKSAEQIGEVSTGAKRLEHPSLLVFKNHI
jgi:hypothetical protein